MFKGLSGSTLKWIAMITMLIDHVAATILLRYMVSDGYTEELYNVYEIMRTIGRVAFPIYCFLLVEGFLHTKNVYRYISRMFVFVLAAELPFDMAFAGQVLYWNYQSVMLTLLIGLVTMFVCKKWEEMCQDDEVLRMLGILACTAAGMALAYYLKTDYSDKGVLSIMTFYYFRREKNVKLLAGALTFCWEPWALLAFPLLWLYNGQRGMKIKYLFYTFYPLHLLLLYLIAIIQGNQYIAVI